MLLLMSFLVLLAWVYLVWGRAQFWQLTHFPPAAEPLAWPSISIIVPARNEADVLPQSLPTLLQQHYPGLWNIILVDDRSDDGTGDVAQKIAAQHASSKLMVLSHNGPPEGWSGKLAAMHAGLAASQSDYVLFTDADIAHPQNQLRTLMAHAVAWSSPLVSLMVKLRCESVAEHYLIPAFVYFFHMLYPCRHVWDDRKKIGAAAGGVMLVHRQTLHEAGGLEKIKHTLIDDCSLGQMLKDHVRAARRTVILANATDTHSLRGYGDWKNIRDMIARTAFEQLQFSYPFLGGCVVGLGLLFVWPVLALLFGGMAHKFFALLTLGLMVYSYLPMIRYYGRPLFQALSLPVVAVAYVVATLHSARQYARGLGGSWKGRHYAPEPHA